MKKKKEFVLNEANLRNIRDFKEERSFSIRFGSFALATILAILCHDYGIKDYRKVTNRNLSEILFNYDDIDLDTVRDKIYSSNKLSDEDKEYLYNPEFFNDILPYVNSSQYSKRDLGSKLKDFSIEEYDESDSYGIHFGGYYKTSENILKINSYCTPSKKIDTVSHEFIHLCQEGNEYNLITEACAEILSYEYYDNTVMDAYYTEVYLVKKLMETIGSEPIEEYFFTGYFDSAEKEIRKYLNDKEYEKFTSLLTIKNITQEGYNEEEENLRKGQLNDMLDMLYERKYGYQSCYDPVIAKLANPKLVRYYFNTNKINQENSYVDYYVETNPVPIKEAFAKGMVNTILKNCGEYWAGYANYNQLEGIKFNKDDEFRCISSYNEPVRIGVNDDNSLYAYTYKLTREFIEPINEKFQGYKSKSLIRK